jgi:hypothetical protein
VIESVCDKDWATHYGNGPPPLHTSLQFELDARSSRPVCGRSKCSTDLRVPLPVELQVLVLSISPSETWKGQN